MEMGKNTDNFNYDDYEMLPDDIVKEKTKSKRHKSTNSAGDYSFNKHLLTTSILHNGKFDSSKVIIKFYSILFSQQLLSFALCFSGMKISFIHYLLGNYQFVFIFNFFICISLSIFSFFFKWPLRTKPYNYIFLAIFTISYATIIAYLCFTLEENTIMMSIFTTFVNTAVFVIYVSISKEKFTFISEIFITIVAGGFHYSFFTVYTNISHTRILFSLVWVIFWGLYVILWTKRISSKVEKVRVCDHILSTFRFYIFILFLLSLIYAMKFNVVSFFRNLGE